MVLFRMWQAKQKLIIETEVEEVAIEQCPIKKLRSHMYAAPVLNPCKFSNFSILLILEFKTLL